jgi:DNA invertase Pin-like site-specific DNA recombinase
MTAVAYIRVSSRAQDLDMQRGAIERAAGARGDAIATWYAEKRSGKVLARPELDRLRADARAGLIQRLYLFRLDRLTRSGIRDTFEVVEELRAHGCHIVTVADGFDLDGPAAEAVLAVMAWAAKMERLAINARPLGGAGAARDAWTARASTVRTRCARRAAACATSPSLSRCRGPRSRGRSPVRQRSSRRLALEQETNARVGLPIRPSLVALP